MPTAKFDEFADFERDNPVRVRVAAALTSASTAIAGFLTSGCFSADRDANEICVVCGATTDIPANLPVEFRQRYVQGVGQCCECCA